MYSPEVSWIGSFLKTLGSALQILQTAMQRRARQMRDRRLQGVEAIVERKQRVLTEGDDNRFLFNREHRGRRRLRSRRRVSGSRSALPLGDLSGVSACETDLAG